MDVPLLIGKLLRYSQQWSDTHAGLRWSKKAGSRTKGGSTSGWLTRSPKSVLVPHEGGPRSTKEGSDRDGEVVQHDDTRPA
eukprot:7135998-Prymnesium_polylepis.1